MDAVEEVFKQHEPYVNNLQPLLMLFTRLRAAIIAPRHEQRAQDAPMQAEYRPHSHDERTAGNNLGDRKDGKKGWTHVILKGDHAAAADASAGGLQRQSVLLLGEHFQCGILYRV